MFNIHKKLFLALKKVWVVKINHPQVPITWKKNLPSKIPPLSPPTHTPFTAIWKTPALISFWIILLILVFQYFRQVYHQWKYRSTYMGGGIQFFSTLFELDGYCIDIIWCLCVNVKIQQRVVWFCKAYLGICYVGLFDWKGPLMLKTDSSIF